MHIYVFKTNHKFHAITVLSEANFKGGIMRAKVGKQEKISL